MCLEAEGKDFPTNEFRNQGIADEESAQYQEKSVGLIG